MVGDVPVGGGAPVSVQSMTTTKTADVNATLTQIYALRGAGADIVRVTCNDIDAAQGLADIVPRSPVPIIADIHFHYRLALASLEAGVAGLRLNPGNIRKEEHIKAVARAASDAGVSIRVGVNAGSLDRDLLDEFGGPVPEALVRSALHEISYLEDVGFHDIKISVKHSNVPSMVESYRLLAERVEYPLHLGVTEAGPPPGGLIKSVAGIATLLLEGIEGGNNRHSRGQHGRQLPGKGRQQIVTDLLGACRILVCTGLQWSLPGASIRYRNAFGNSCVVRSNHRWIDESQNNPCQCIRKGNCRVRIGCFVSESKNRQATPDCSRSVASDRQPGK
jgi:hypothetical protein